MSDNWLPESLKVKYPGSIFIEFILFVILLVAFLIFLSLMIKRLVAIAPVVVVNSPNGRESQPALPFGAMQLLKDDNKIIGQVSTLLF